MGRVSRWKNRVMAFAAGRFRFVADRFVEGYTPVTSDSIPWTPVARPLKASAIAMVTTAGVHHPDQEPFDMDDPDGDPSFRVLDAGTIGSDWRITHDYYDHRDADRDLNVVFPITRFFEMAAAGRIGRVAGRHFSLMGHIDGPHIRTLTETVAPRVAEALRRDRVDAVLLTPG